MTKPIRLQRKRVKGFNMQAESFAANGLPCIIVSRPGKWGNPYKVMYLASQWQVLNRSPESWALYHVGSFDTKKEALAYCLEKYKEHILRENSAGRLDIGELANKNLSCFCSLECPCHADVLLKLSGSYGQNT